MEVAPRSRRQGHFIAALTCVVSAAALLSCAGSTHFQREHGPRTVDEAVALLRSQWLSEDDLDRILRNPESRVVARLHFPFGLAVRNEFGLWKGNSDLITSCGQAHPDECSDVIFERLWESVRENADTALVMALDRQFRYCDVVVPGDGRRQAEAIPSGEVTRRHEAGADEGVCHPQDHSHSKLRVAQVKPGVSSTTAPEFMLAYSDRFRTADRVLFPASFSR